MSQIVSKQAIRQAKATLPPTIRHRGITARALGVVDILVSGKPPEHRLPQQINQPMPPAPAGAGIAWRDKETLGSLG